MDKHSPNDGCNGYCEFVRKLAGGEQEERPESQDAAPDLNELSPPETFKERLSEQLLRRNEQAPEGFDRVLEIVERHLGNIPAKPAALYTIAMAINAYCADSELLLPRLGGPKEGRLELFRSLQRLAGELGANPSLMRPLAAVTGQQLLWELFDNRPPTAIEVLDHIQEAVTRDYYRETEPQPFQSDEKEVDRDYPWLVKPTPLHPKIFSLMGAPMIDPKVEGGGLYARSCPLSPFQTDLHRDPQRGQILVPGAGLNGLRLLPRVWRMNWEAQGAYQAEEHADWDLQPRFGKVPHCLTVLVNDRNPFVAEVWEAVARTGVLPQGYAEVKFLHGNLGGEEYLSQVQNPASLVLSQVQIAGPEPLKALISRAAQAHSECGQRGELRVVITMQRDRSEPNDAVISDLEPALRELELRCVSDRSFQAIRKCPASGERELDFTEFTYQDYWILRSKVGHFDTRPVAMGEQIWEKAGTDGFRTVWVRD